MIITDPKERPSARFIEVLKVYFIGQGYDFKKSARKFEKSFERGKQEISLSFLNLSAGTEAELKFGLTFTKFEKLFAVVKGWKKKQETGVTFGTELNHLPEIRYSDRFYTFPLYDSRSFKVDDISINKAAESFIDAFEQFVVPFFEYYKSLENVAKCLNKLPIAHPVITSWTDKHILFGLLLASYYSPQYYQSILSSYQDYIDTMCDIKKSELKQFLIDAEIILMDINKSEVLN